MNAVDAWLALVAAHVERGTFAKAVLAKYRGAEPGLERIVVRPVLLRGERRLAFATRYATREMMRNLPPAAAVDALRAQLASFGHAHLFAADEEAQLLIGKRGTATLHRSAPGAAAPTTEPKAAEPPAHDRAKRRWVDVDAPFLAALGVTDAEHRVVPAMARKWKQINRFVEVFDHAFAASPLVGAARVRVADYGSGKGYLTFALHAHLVALGIAPKVTGVEWQPELVRFCNDVAARTGAAGLAFVQGDVSSHDLGAIDVMIALHACDTATDHAIHRAIRAGAAIVMTAPCCHKELRPQITTPAVLKPVLRHGVHLGQQAEMITDGLRALLLDAEGYDAQVFEFVSLEHTSKNKMILAVKRRDPPPDAAGRRERIGAQIRALMDHYAVGEQRLVRLLAEDRVGVGVDRSVVT